MQSANSKGGMAVYLVKCYIDRHHITNADGHVLQANSVELTGR